MGEDPQELTREEEAERDEAWLLVWQEQVNKVHPQRRPLRRDDFRRFLQERDLGQAGGALEEFERQGVLWPAILTPLPPGITVTLGAGELRAIRDLDQPVLPGTSGAWDWRNDTEAAGTIRVRERYYHPLQAIRLWWMQWVLTHRVSTISAPSTAFWQREVEDWLRRDATTLAALRRNLGQSFRNLALLLATEDLYLPEVRGVAGSTWAADVPGEGRQDYQEWRNSIDPHEIRRRLGLNVDGIRALRNALANTGRQLDPNEKLYVLLRAIPYEERIGLKGAARLAWDYYEAVDVLGLFLRDLTSKAEPHVDDLLDGGLLKEELFGIPADRFDYTDHTVLAAIGRRYGLDGSPRVLWIVEGETELEFVRTLCERHSIDLRSSGVDLQSMGGLNKTNDPIFRSFVMQVQQWRSALVVTIDNEHGAKQVRTRIRKLGIAEHEVRLDELDDIPYIHGVLTWERNFETDNFTHQLLFEAWSRSQEDTVPPDRDILDARGRAGKYRLHLETTGGVAPADLVEFMEEVAKRCQLHYSKPAVGRRLAEVVCEARDRGELPETLLPIEKVINLVLGTAGQLRSGHMIYEGSPGDATAPPEE